MENRYVIIMAGGVGSRFWPLSRREKPKQFLDIMGNGETLLQQTFRRFKATCPEKNIYIVTSADHKEEVQKQLQTDPSNILAEPFRRNTAPCIAYATFRIYKENPNAVITVTPADHLIVKEEKFCNVIRESMDFVKDHDALLTLGIQPDRPETGYGYIQADMKRPVEGYDHILRVKTFTEKPDLELAKKFIQSGDFYWNSGIFIWNIKSIITAFEKHLPDMHTAFDDGLKYYSTGEEESFIGRTYSQCRSISIDYGIMEKADNVYVKYTDVGWSDLGTWSSLYEHSNLDSNRNAVISGNVFSYDNRGSIFNIAPGKVAVVQGLDDYIVVDSDDVLLIVRKEEEQNIKNFLEDVRKETNDKYQ
ncbi:MAG TPA: mannose-1-phosphate guanylyltransferase [Bacteroidales bacterium]|nr:mannose-1-phosphate guanylyltransferase [Bacteroidales bacterium]HPJ59228.1 mannose-1-phosphate guanylyltransferase [Bacteroidales bacterium]HPR11851.1 mannose-1-phosphate guanylyltransferase [Bacteroidales bacterium]HRW84000.1 mannose-1-phosphate guanylyltransferase [Bacteroidales bacterium]